MVTNENDNPTIDTGVDKGHNTLLTNPSTDNLASLSELYNSF